MKSRRNGLAGVCVGLTIVASMAGATTPTYAQPAGAVASAMARTPGASGAPISTPAELASTAKGSVMGLASYSGKPLRNAKVLSVRRLGGKKIPIAKSVRTDSKGGFTATLRKRTPKQFIVTVKGGRYGDKKLRGTLSSYGKRSEPGEYINEATTVATMVGDRTDWPFTKSVRRTAKNLCVASSDLQRIYELGQMGSVRSAVFAPARVANKGGNRPTKYMRRLARDVARGDQHCFRPKADVAVRPWSSEDQSSSNLPPVVVALAKMIGEPIAEAIKNEAENMINDYACELDKDTGGLMALLAECDKPEPAPDPLAKVFEQLGHITSQLNSVKDSLDALNKRLDKGESRAAYRRSQLGELYKHLYDWQAAMQMITAPSVQVKEFRALGQATTDREICDAAYDSKNIPGSGGQTAFSACLLAGRISDDFERKWVKDIVAALTTLGVDSTADQVMLVPAMQKVALNDGEHGFLATKRQNNLLRAVTGYIQQQSIGLVHLTAWQAFTQQWRQGRRDVCEQLPSEYTPARQTQAWPFNTACATIHTGHYVLSIEGLLTGNAPQVMPEHALISTSARRPEYGWTWWSAAVDLTGGQSLVDSPITAKWPFYTVDSSPEYLRSTTKLSRAICPDDPGECRGMQLVEGNDHRFRFVKKAEAEALLDNVMRIESRKLGEDKSVNARLRAVGFRGPGKGKRYVEARGERWVDASENWKAPQWNALLGVSPEYMTFRTRRARSNASFGTDPYKQMALRLYAKKFKAGAECPQLWPTENRIWPLRGDYSCTQHEPTSPNWYQADVTGVWSRTKFDLTGSAKPPVAACRSALDVDGVPPSPPTGANAYCFGPQYAQPGSRPLDNENAAKGTYGLLVNTQGGTLIETSIFSDWKRDTFPGVTWR